MGGLIKVHTKSPFSYQGTDFRMGAGTYNAYNTSLTHYHRLSERFAFSTGGFTIIKGGFFRNTVRDEKADKGAIRQADASAPSTSPRTTGRWT